MSQDNYYKRLRTDNNIPLSQLDLNQVHNVSNIPQLSSSLKRSSHRASARQSMIGAPRTTSMAPSVNRNSSTGINEMVQQSAVRNGRRKSLAGLNSVSRPTHRASSFGLGTLSQSKDPRPLRDRNFQTSIQQEIFDFLITHNFETEMRHPLSVKALKNPTQKDFVVIFQFLYKKVDPGYRFLKSIEHEVYYVLKNIKYPYLDSINKSQISAVGGQSWPVFLGMLHWLVQLILKIEDLSVTDFAEDEVPEELDDGIEKNDLEMDKIFTNYIVKSYNAFLNNVDDYTEFFNQMKSDYENYTESIVKQTQEFSEENLQMRGIYQKLLAEAESLNVVEKKAEALRSDLFKFKAYIESMENRKLKWGNVLEQIKQEMINSEVELARTDEEKKQIQEQLSVHGLTPKDIDRMNNDRDRVSKSIDALNVRLEEISRIVHSKELEAQQAYEELSTMLKEYNLGIYTVASISPDFDVSKFTIRLDNLLSEDRLGLQPAELLNGQNLRTLRLDIQKLKSDINIKVHQAQDEAISYQEKLDSLGETINEKSEEVESQEAKLSAKKLNYEELYETMTKDANFYHTEIERFESELSQIQSNSKQNMLLLEQQTKTIDMEYQKLANNVQQEREILHSKAQKMMDTVITFKLNIQGSLEDLENMVIDELEKQRSEEIV